LSIYDFSKDVRGSGRRRRLLVDEDFSWSEVPRRRGTEVVAAEPPRRSEPTHSFSEPVAALVDERDDLETFDDGVEVVDLRGNRRYLSGDLGTQHEMPAGEGPYSDGDPYLAPGSIRDDASAAGRRTIVITGHGAERRLPVRQHSGAGLRVHERSGFKPDRIALWAFLLALALLLGATTSSHAATLVQHLPH